MASKAVRQTYGLLTVAFACAVELRKTIPLADSEAISSAEKLADNLIRFIHWVDSTEFITIKDQSIIKKWNRKWDAVVESTTVEELRPFYMYMILHILDDLGRKISNREKGMRMQVLLGSTLLFLEYIDKDGLKFDAMDDAKQMLDRLYQIYDFTN